MNFEELKNDYTKLWNSVVITKNPDENVNTIIKNKSRYESVGIVPWDVLGCIHMLESSFNFNRHLHNGDPLSARTVQVPAGRPKSGTPPFTWEFSAKDALSDRSITSEWSIEYKLYFLENYNGFGYRKYRKINSPYLWSYTNHYTSGKYVKDGKWDPTAVSKQCGAASVLKRLEERGLINHTIKSKNLDSSPVLNDNFNDVEDKPKEETIKRASISDLIFSFLNVFLK